MLYLLPDYCKGRETLQNLCEQIAGDALLYSLFKEDAEPVKCPLEGKIIMNQTNLFEIVLQNAMILSQVRSHSHTIAVMVNAKTPYQILKAVPKKVGSS